MSWEKRVVTGHPSSDQREVEQLRAHARSQGMDLQVMPLPQGGLHVRAVPVQPLQPHYGAPQAQLAGFGQPAYGSVPMGGGFASPAAASPELGKERVKYLQKVYGLLAVSAVFAFVAAGLAVTVGEVPVDAGARGTVMVPLIPALVLQSSMVGWIMFGALFLGTIVASSVSRVKGLNLIALFAVSALMGLELAPMAWVAQFLASDGQTLSASPIRDTILMVSGIFAGLTAYVIITKKDFSYLKATLSMGFFVVFVGCLMTMFFQSEAFSLAMASAGAVLSIGFLLYQTSYILKNSDMDNPVGDALGLLIQLRNLFMFILRIFMSSRR